MRSEILRLLDTLDLTYQSVEHAPILTMAEGESVARRLGVVPCKTLFLVDRHKHYYLLVLAGDKHISLKEVARQAGCSRLSFASDEEMQHYLSTAPGAVSLFGLLYDKENQVQLLLDKEIPTMEFIGCHPCENRCSLKLRTEEVLTQLLPALHHAEYTLIDTD